MPRCKEPTRRPPAFRAGSDRSNEESKKQQNRRVIKRRVGDPNTPEKVRLLINRQDSHPRQ